MTDHIYKRAANLCHSVNKAERVTGVDRATLSKMRGKQIARRHWRRFVDPLISAKFGRPYKTRNVIAKQVRYEIEMMAKLIANRQTR